MITMKGKYNTANIMIDSIDETTKAQIQGFLNHPAFANTYIAIMPDCLHPETEVLTTTGYKLICELKEEDKVANFNPVTEVIQFFPVRCVISRRVMKDEIMYKLTNNRLGELSILTSNHRNAYIPDMGVTTERLPLETKIKDYYWCGTKDNSFEEGISDELIQLIAWVVGDGSIHSNNNKKNKSYRVRFGFKKERKIRRVIDILRKLNIDFSCKETSKQTEIEIKTEDSKLLINLVGLNKHYPINWISSLSSRQKKIFLYEAIQVDGDYNTYVSNRGFRLNSSRIEDINFFSALSSVIGTSKITRREVVSNLTNKNSIMYYLSVIKNESLYSNRNGLPSSIIKKIKLEENEKPDEVWCLTCDTGFFVYRFRGRTGITGNCHAGKGAVIGFTMKMNEYIIPNIIGVDLGCGVLSCNFGKIDIDLEGFDSFVKREIPSGFNINNKAKVNYCSYGSPLYYDVYRVALDLDLDIAKVANSIGSLGGGNHFIEIGKDSDEDVWITIHSGSRNFGLRVANHFQNIAKTNMEKYFIQDQYKDLEFLLVDSKEGQDYLRCAKVAQYYAKINRQSMMNTISDYLGVSIQEMILSVHNYIGYDNIIRKGAISAQKDKMVLIPFNMRDGIAVCRGKGCKKYNESAPHGAGRILSRTKAKETLSVEGFVNTMKEAGVYTTTANIDTLDEAPDAYKDKQIILDNIVETVDVIDFIKPIYNFKAGE